MIYGLTSKTGSSRTKTTQRSRKGEKRSTKRRSHAPHPIPALSWSANVRDPTEGEHRWGRTSCPVLGEDKSGSVLWLRSGL
ncbi:unnamed protein product [Boreogadus saida]